MFEDFVPFFLAMSSSSGIFPRRLGAPQMRPVRLVVRTPPFHGGNTGSSPVRVAISPQLSHPRVGVNCFWPWPKPWPFLSHFLKMDGTDLTEFSNRD